MHSTRPWHGDQRTADTYREDIPAVSDCKNGFLITVIRLQDPPYLCTQVRVSPRIPHPTL